MYIDIFILIIYNYILLQCQKCIPLFYFAQLGVIFTPDLPKNMCKIFYCSCVDLLLDLIFFAPFKQIVKGLQNLV